MNDFQRLTMKLARYLSNETEDESCLEAYILPRGLEAIISLPDVWWGVQWQGGAESPGLWFDTFRSDSDTQWVDRTGRAKRF